MEDREYVRRNEDRDLDDRDMVRGFCADQSADPGFCLNEFPGLDKESYQPKTLNRNAGNISEEP